MEIQTELNVIDRLINFKFENKQHEKDLYIFFLEGMYNINIFAIFLCTLYGYNKDNKKHHILPDWIHTIEKNPDLKIIDRFKMPFISMMHYTNYDTGLHHYVVFINDNVENIGKFREFCDLMRIVFNTKINNIQIDTIDKKKREYEIIQEKWFS